MMLALVGVSVISIIGFAIFIYPIIILRIKTSSSSDKENIIL